MKESARDRVYSVQRDSHRNDYRAVNYSQVPRGTCSLYATLNWRLLIVM